MLIRGGTALRIGSSISFLTAVTCQFRQSPASSQHFYSTEAIMSPAFHNEPSAKTLIDAFSNYTIKHQADGGNGAKHLQKSQWHIPAGSYTPRQIVQSCSPLLETVLYHLGPDRPNEPAREMLLGNLASNLRLDSREASLRLADIGLDRGRHEMAAQAKKIGQTIVQYAREAKHPEFDKTLDIRSPCEGHLLSHAVAGLMFGPRSQRHLMQVYNEYLHQMVLLRDSLLPFENYEEVIIPLHGKKGRELGMRYTQQSRTVFVAELMTRSISQDSVFQVARSLLAPKLPSTGGYAFQYLYGTVLPAFVTGSDSFRLLHYSPTKLDQSTSDVLFDYELEDYYTAPRTEVAAEIGIHPAHSWSKQTFRDLSAGMSLSRYKVSAEASKDQDRSNIRLLQLQLEFENGICAAVDLGQISRGSRYLYNSISSTNGRVNTQQSVISATGFSVDSYLHSPIDVLTKSGNGLVISKKAGIHLIPTSDSIVKLALLGKIYPENTVLLTSDQDPSVVEKSGKSLPESAKFVIYEDI